MHGISTEFQAVCADESVSNTPGLELGRGAAFRLCCVCMCTQGIMVAVNLGGHNIWAGHIAGVSEVLELPRYFYFKGFGSVLVQPVAQDGFECRPT